MNTSLEKAAVIRKPKTFLYSLLRPIGWITFSVVYPLRVVNRSGLQHLKAPYILIANHKNAIDPGILGLLCPDELWCLGKKELVSRGLRERRSLPLSKATSS